MIPEYNSTSIRVTAFGEFGQEFFHESYKYMDLQLEAELVLNKGKTESEHIVFTRDLVEPNLFTV